MFFFLFFVVMTSAAILAILWPLGRREGRARAASSLEIYRDQLSEVEADLGAGLIAPEEAVAARAEISRRLLAADHAPDQPLDRARHTRIARRVTAILALVLLPLASVALYFDLGSPQAIDQPLAGRSVNAQETDSLRSLVSKVEAHLDKNPNEGQGWNVLAPALMRLGRYDDAVRAYGRVIALLGENASRRADLGEAMVSAANGVVTDDAKRQFESARALDASEPKANFFLALAARQDGRPQEAIAIWQKMLRDAPGGAPWVALVKRALAQSGANQAGAEKSGADASDRAKPDDAGALTPGPTAGEVAAAANLSAAERAEMIKSMVARLAARLKEQPGDGEGWLRLVRAYSVMGERDKARAALDEARKALVDSAEALTKLNAEAARLGL